MAQASWLRPLVIVCALALPAVAHADVVTSFHSDITVSRADVATVKETIVYDPQDDSHHGIYRYVPDQYKDAAGHTYYSTIKFISVTDEQGDDYNIAGKSQNREQLYLKIGDPHQTLSPGPHTYVISYQISPMVVKGDGFDRFIFNVTGQGWQTDITKATADIKFDSASDVTSAICFVGETGSTAQDCSATHTQPREVVVEGSNLTVGDGLTADINLGPGSVTAYLQSDVVPPLSPGDKAALGLAGLAAALGALGLLRIFWYWWQDHRERKDQVVIAQYEPPDGLSPAQMSILESPRSDVADITATLIDLAVRGFIKIEQIAAKTWYRGAQYRLIRLPHDGPMAGYESRLTDAIFAGSDMVNLGDLKNDTSRGMKIRSAIQNMRKEIGNDLKRKEYYKTSPTSGIALLRLLTAFAGIVTALVMILVISGGDSYSWWPVLLGLASSIVGLGLTFMRTDRTLLGNEEWAKVEGFKLFLNVTQKDRLNFTDAPEKTPELFSKMLPYAVALKVEKQWAKQFEGIDTARAVQGWYVGPAFFNSSAFAGDFSSSFGGAVSSSFAGASGAGGAGGGGGGGGGGGW